MQTFFFLLPLIFILSVFKFSPTLGFHFQALLSDRQLGVWGERPPKLFRAG